MCSVLYHSTNFTQNSVLYLSNWTIFLVMGLVCRLHCTNWLDPISYLIIFKITCKSAKIGLKILWNPLLKMYEFSASEYVLLSENAQWSCTSFLILKLLLRIRKSTKGQSEHSYISSWHWFTASQEDGKMCANSHLSRFHQ